MASTKVRGITIELGADTSGLSKALKGVNTEIGKTQKDLKDVERLLKLDPSNTELLAQKQKLLNDQVAETKTKLDALKQAQDSIDLSTEDGQRQYDALTREIVSCENELKQAEQAASSFNATAQKISVAAGKMSQKFGDLANKTKGLSMAAGGALVGWQG
jgi:phage-related minor tail protein